MSKTQDVDGSIESDISCERQSYDNTYKHICLTIKTILFCKTILTIQIKIKLIKIKIKVRREKHHAFINSSKYKESRKSVSF